MDLSITSSVAYTTATAKSSKTADKTDKVNESAKEKTSATDAGVIYEKSSNKSSEKNVSSSTDRSAIIKQLKAEQETRKSQLIDLVRSTMTGQGKAISKATSLADLFRNLEVDEETVAQAKKDIAEDGYWGVNQTSDRLVSMAQALAGGDKTKADELIGAIKKGFEQATQAWGEELPSICSDTINSAVDKLTKWRDSISE